MEKNSKPKGKYNEFSDEENFILDNFTSSASEGDCTGLIPSGSVNSAEKFNNYKDIYTYGVPIKQKNDKKS